MLLPDDPHVYAFTRALAGTTLLVLGNFSGTRQDVTLDDAAVPVDWDSAEQVLGNYPADPAARRLHLRPWELKVLRTRATLSGR
jgi:oligo-1,6-glucosidase